jgi:hypothetical protein
MIGLTRATLAGAALLGGQPVIAQQVADTGVDTSVTKPAFRAGVAFDSRTPEVWSGRWAHAVAVGVGSGRVAMFGEAAMFSAQLAGPSRAPMGMNHPHARFNKQLLLNTFHWLSGLID